MKASTALSVYVCNFFMNKEAVEKLLKSSVRVVVQGESWRYAFEDGSVIQRIGHKFKVVRNEKA